MFNDRTHGTVCPYCNTDTAERRQTVPSKDGLADIPMNYEALNPVCGWIVCIEGSSRGHAYKIKVGKNFIGRADDMDIQILGDDKIAHRKHAVIAYDPKKRNTVMLPGDSGELVYCQGEPVYTPIELAVNNNIEMGNSKFLFVPFCGSDFNWGDVGI
jgi:hypothetical protein